MVDSRKISETQPSLQRGHAAFTALQKGLLKLLRADFNGRLTLEVDGRHGGIRHIRARLEEYLDEPTVAGANTASAA